MADSDGIVTILRWAADTVEEAGLPEDLRPPAFQYLLSAGGATGLATIPDPSEISPVALRAPADEPLLEEVARRMEAPIERIQRIYEQDDQQLRLVLPRTWLPEPGRKAASMRDVALLVVVGRQSAGLEEYTPYDAIRDECRELNVYDQPNFAAEIAKLEFRTRGTGKAREARANRHHFEQAAELVGRLGQEADS